jgi:sec-independent protein translocase protein TatA
LKEQAVGEFSITHWLIILAILLLFFGPSKLPGLGSSLGKAIRGFKAGLNEIDPNQPAESARPEQITSATSTTTASKVGEKEKEPHNS